MDSKTLFGLSVQMAEIEDALWENGGEFTEEIALALQETQTGIAHKTDAYTSLIRSFSAQRDIIKAEIDRLNKLKKVAENAEKRIKQHVCETMGMFGIEKMEGEKSKITRARTTAIEVNEEQIVAAYQKNLDELNASLPPYISAELKVSKTAIKEFQKEEGILPAGAEIVENYSLRIR